MDVKQIQWGLTRLFHNHTYHLYNSFVYNWECDYYSKSKSGYDYEIEIKLSRSDFIADFKKVEKHKLLSAALAKKTHVVVPYSADDSQLLCKVECAELRKFNRISSMWNNGKWMNGGTPGEIEMQEHKEMLSNYKDYYLYKYMKHIYLPATKIYIKEVAKLLIPHCFYYACPQGLIKSNEIPEYAGLIWIDDLGNASTVKKAPYLHKRECDLTKVLLSKFYYETVNHRINNRKIDKL